MSVSTTLPLSVHNTGFLLDRLGEDCHPLQFLRELTQNAIEAVRRTEQGEGDITWDVDWLTYQDTGVFKLCVIDNGVGMTGDEMERYINQLSSSASRLASDGNYGVGAKIAAATRNHAGLIYLSWKESRGSMITLWRDSKTGQYGLQQIERPDGSFGHHAEIYEDVKPEQITEHGTKIVLLGMSTEVDTMKAPSEAASPSKWIAKYLNGRYFRIPKGITIRAREGWEQPRSNGDVNVLRRVTGMEEYLDAHSESHGSLKLTDAVAHWWVLKDEKALTSNSGFIESGGHVAALYQDELYELSTGRSGSAKLQQFGIIYGQNRVVIYVEPDASGAIKLTTNTARTSLLLNSESLPWTDWMSEFRLNLPDEIHKLMEDIASKSSASDHAKSIRERLRSLLDLYRVSRYRMNSNGNLRIGDPEKTAGGETSSSVGLFGSMRSNSSGGKRGGIVGGVYSTYLKKNGMSGSQIRPDPFPEVTWVSLKEGTRIQGDIEDKAARYLEESNQLLINADFRVFTDMINHWHDKYLKENGDVAGLRDRIIDSVHDWFEQALTETVIGIQALKGSREWSSSQLQGALSEEALTAVVMQRYHPYNSIKRELGTKIGPLKK
jgi:hypothetical protein